MRKVNKNALTFIKKLSFFVKIIDTSCFVKKNI